MFIVTLGSEKITREMENERHMVSTASSPGSLRGGACEEEKESLVQTDPEHTCIIP